MQNYHNYTVNLSNCDREPIHIIGRVQPHGFLMVVHNETFVIEQVSENVCNMVPGGEVKQLLGKSVLDLLPEGSRSWFENSFLTTGYGIIALGGRKFYGFNHVSADKIIIECEVLWDSSDKDRLWELDNLSCMAGQLNGLEKAEEMANLVAGEMRNYLDYDRVNVMRFDNNWNSEVIGESLKGATTSILGHRFPASDIPLAGRNMLLKKTIRQIPNVQAKAVDIIPYINSTTGTPTDILKSELRNPSEIHLEYLNNMEVSATISFSILSKGKLWGLISCHNYSPIFVDAWKRKVSGLMTQALASEITSIQKSTSLKEYKQLNQNRLRVVEKLEKHKDLISGLRMEDPDILDITLGSGVAIFLNNQLYTYGSTPTEEEIESLLGWLVYSSKKKVFTTRSLWKAFPEAMMYKDTACGLMALEISKYNLEYLLFFKPEIPRTRIWAGKPEKLSLNGKNYIHPRRSFEKWEETVRGKSLKWNSNEKEIAKLFVKDLTAFELRDQASSLRALNSQLEITAKRLVEKNNQLKDFGLIMAHNLRGPMNNILLLHECYRDEPTESNAQFFFQKIPSIVDNLFQTMTDLEKIIATQLEEDLPSEEVYLADLIDKEWENLQNEEIMHGRAELISDLQVTAFYLPKVYAESFLHNLISNALKYRSGNRNPQVRVKSWEDEKHVYLSVSDNGLGMDLEAVGENLFGLYKTFHGHKHAKGMGLYLTKMQIEALEGNISVESEPDMGTTFTIWFPKVRVLIKEMN